MVDFFRTGMGATFFNGTMPSLVRELKRLNDNLEAQNELTRETHRFIKEDVNREEAREAKFAQETGSDLSTTG